MLLVHHTCPLPTELDVLHTSLGYLSPAPAIIAPSLSSNIYSEGHSLLDMAVSFQTSGLAMSYIGVNHILARILGDSVRTKSHLR